MTLPNFHVHGVGDFASIDDIIGASVPSPPPDANEGAELLLRRIASMVDAMPELAFLKWNGEVILKSDLGRDAADKLIALLEPLSSKIRHRILRKVRRSIRDEKREKEAERAGIEETVAYLERAQAAAGEVGSWLQSGFVLQSPPTTRLHHLREAFGTGEVFDFTRSEGRPTDADVTEWIEMIDCSSVFVVEHNWAAAFDGAKDFDAGEVHLPADVCAFEFRISGRHVIAFAAEIDGTFHLQFASQSPAGQWSVLPRRSNPNDPVVEPLSCLAFSQIRAISIALDADVAESVVVRAPHKLNRARAARGHGPIFDYHVVSLARRSRAPRLPSMGIEGLRSRRRLHFRRGHWRHYENHKTWIKWMLVGSPDLGFVDKHYRL